MFELRHLRHAVGLAEHRNFVRAAAALNITQPALTRSIQTLEDMLGVQLFDRSRTGVSPTQFGELVLQRARELLASSRDLQRELDLARGLELGELNIGVGPFGGAMLVGAAIARLNVRFPKLSIKILVAPWRELPDRLRAGDIDLLVLHVSELMDQADLAVQMLAAHPGILVCRQGHPLVSKANATIADVFSYPMAGPNLPTGKLQDLLAQLPRDLPASVCEQLRKQGVLNIVCDSSSILKTVVAQSDAMTFLSAFMVLAELRSGDLVALPKIKMGLQGQFGLAHLRGRSLSLPAQAFVSEMRAWDAEVLEQERVLLEKLDGSDSTR